jgi:pimeloyl-ACP methyl ester carboxylesterase
MRWQVHGLELEGLAWGPEGGRPVLALHGWLDNAASFALLAPLLAGCRVVALDLTGHGHSARRSRDAGYQIYDDLPEVIGVVDALGWQTFDLLGHSRGGIISALLASAFPERVRRLVMLDAVAPEPVPEAQFAAQLRQSILDKQRLLDRKNRTFNTVDDAVASRVRGGLEESAARLIAERNLDSNATGLTWSTDPRLTGASMVKLSPGQVRAVLGALTMPVLLLLASHEGRRLPGMEQLARECIPDLKIEGVEGGHHFHMEQSVHTAAGYINDFLAAGDDGV